MDQRVVFHHKEPEFAQQSNWKASNPRVVWKPATEQVQRLVYSRRRRSSPVDPVNDIYEDFLEIKLGKVYFKKLYKSKASMPANDLEELAMPSVKSLKSIFETVRTVQNLDKRPKPRKKIILNGEEPGISEKKSDYGEVLNGTSHKTEKITNEITDDTTEGQPPNGVVNGSSTLSESSSKLQNLRYLFERSVSVPSSFGNTFEPRREKKLDSTGLSTDSSTTDDELVSSTPLTSPEHDTTLSRTPEDPDTVGMSVSKMRQRWEQMTMENNSSSYSLSSSQSSPNLSKVPKDSIEADDSAVALKETPSVDIVKSESASEVALLTRNKERSSVRKLAKLFSTPLFQPPKVNKNKSSVENNSIHCQNTQITSIEQIENDSDVIVDELKVTELEDPSPMKPSEVPFLTSTHLPDDIISNNVEPEVTETQAGTLSSAKTSPTLQRRGSIKKLLQKFDVAPEYGINKFSAFIAKRFHDSERPNLLADYPKITPKGSNDCNDIFREEESIDMKLEFVKQEPDDISNENGHIDKASNIHPESNVEEKTVVLPEVEISDPVENTENITMEVNESTDSEVPLPRDDSSSVSSANSPRLSRHRKLHDDELSFFKDSAATKPSDGEKRNGKRCRSLHPDELTLFTQEAGDFFSIKTRSLSDGGMKKIPKMDLVEISST